jgi:hypothetical protein
MTTIDKFRSVMKLGGEIPLGDLEMIRRGIGPLLRNVPLS